MHLVTAMCTAVYKREGAFGLQPLFSQKRFCSKAIAVSITWVAYFPPGLFRVCSINCNWGIRVLCDLCWAFTQTWFHKTLLCCKVHLMECTMLDIHISDMYESKVVCLLADLLCDGVFLTTNWMTFTAYFKTAQ